MIRLYEPSDLEDIKSLLTSNSWDYHSSVINAATLTDKDNSYFTSDTNRTLVYTNSDNVLKGYIRFFDIEDSDTDSPLFDIRVDQSARGSGVGSQLLREGVRYIFNTFLQIRRIEGTTRADNIAMQKVFEHVGFKHEATYRKSWRTLDGEHMDTFGYGLLKEEFK
jgi:RimJ/RimL family protein N-acetyltransferase